MKKNKGFTLVELLAIIVIVGLLIGLTGYTVTKVLKRTKENIKEQNLSALVDAGNTYMNQVVDGKDTYQFGDSNYSGYKLLTTIAENCDKYSENTCKVIKKDTVNNIYSGRLMFSLDELKDYIDISKFSEDKCFLYAYVTVTKNDKGYYILDKIEVKPSDDTKAKECVLSE